MAGEARIPFDLAPGRVFEKLGDLGKFAGAVRARAGERIMRNKANFVGFGAENGGAAEKQSQSGPDIARLWPFDIGKPEIRSSKSDRNSRGVRRERRAQECETKPLLRVLGLKMGVRLKNKANLQGPDPSLRFAAFRMTRWARGQAWIAEAWPGVAGTAVDWGRRYIFHNTALQPNGALNVFSGHGICNAISKNNIFRVRGDTYPSRRGDGPPNDFRSDLTGGYLAGGFVRSMFVPSDRLEWFLAATVPVIKWGKVEYSRSGREFTITDPVVQVPNPAIDKGVLLPGFNDDYQGAAPDIGAFESGNLPLRFGREASSGFKRAPWEIH